MKTLALIKPDAYARGLVGEIVTRIEREKFGILSVRHLDPRALYSVAHGGYAEGWSPRDFYARQHLGAHYFEALVAFMEGGPSLALVLERDDAIAHWRKTMGSWKEKDITTIRGLYMRPGDLSMCNLVHGSDSVESFEHEVRVLESEGMLP